MRKQAYVNRSQKETPSTWNERVRSQVSSEIHTRDDTHLNKSNVKVFGKAIIIWGTRLPITRQYRYRQQLHMHTY